jgi:hypothetical protein
MVRRAVLAATMLALGACAPKLNDRTFLVTHETVLAVRAEPAEAPPGAQITYTALVATPTGELAAPIDWAFCTERAPLASLGTVNVDCLAASGDAITPFGTPGTTATGTLPMNGCRVFGPEVPTVGPHDPPGRPVDPDETGGYYQPVRLLDASTPSAPAIERTRIACGLGNGSGDDRAMFGMRYRPNHNPDVAEVELTIDGGAPITVDPATPSAPIAVPTGAHVALRAAWPECPTDLASLPEGGCAGSEPYLVFDAVAQQLTERREAMRVSWHATAGVLDRDGTGRDASDLERTSDDTWTAPDAAGPAWIWVVVRDARGGVGWLRVDLDVTP